MKKALSQYQIGEIPGSVNKGLSGDARDIVVVFAARESGATLGFAPSSQRAEQRVHSPSKSPCYRICPSLSY
jgi:hypothetical protein